MAEALLQRWGGEHFRAFTAGLQVKDEVHPLALDLLKTNGLWKESLTSRSVHEFLAPGAPRMDFIINVGNPPPVELRANWAGSPQVYHWRISDPVVDGKPADTALAFRRAFGELETRIKLFVVVYEREVKNRAAA